MMAIFHAQANTQPTLHIEMPEQPFEMQFTYSDNS